MPSERSSLSSKSKYDPISTSTKDLTQNNTFGGDDPMSQIILQDRRHRNLLASKKYRAKKQQMEREKNDRIQSLLNDNQSLKKRVQELEFENKSLKEIMSRLTTSSAASALDNNNNVKTVRERLCRNVDN